MTSLTLVSSMLDPFNITSLTCLAQRLRVVPRVPREACASLIVHPCASNDPTPARQRTTARRRSRTVRWWTGPWWTGPFTDKPYLALLSFLYTQNLGLHLDAEHDAPTMCRPKVWLWISPGPAASVPNRTAMRDMFEQLKSNPWA